MRSAEADARKETGLPVVGCLPPLPEAAVESRHLGLKTAAEIDDLQRKIQLYPMPRSKPSTGRCCAPCLTARARRRAVHGVPAAGAPCGGKGCRVLLHLCGNAGSLAGKRRGLCFSAR